MPQIVLFGAGKSAGFLIDYLKYEAQIHQWRFTVADNDLALAASKLGSGPNLQAVGVAVQNGEERRRLIAGADIIISLLPPALHILLAKDCLLLEKNLLTASYLDDAIKQLSAQIKAKRLLFLCEMGLDPGIDHMSAMQLINRITSSGGNIISFSSHCGGLVAPESDDNSWHYKISWNPRNIVRAGAAGAVYKENNQLVHIHYHNLFSACKTIFVNALGELAYYPNRDSLSYIPLYGLEHARDFIRTTLRHPVFCQAWHAIVKSGLTDDTKHVFYTGLTFQNWSRPLLPFVEANNKSQLEFLGFFEDLPVPETLKTSADILQFLLETKLAMAKSDRDMVVMLHQILFEKQGHEHQVQSLLVVKGEENKHTAMAKTVGLPLGIAAKLILTKKISLTGLHIPILPEIYEPVLHELKNYDVIFKEY